MNNVENFKKLKTEYYAIKGNSVGGNLHIVLDDDNYDDESINFCEQACIKSNDEKGKELCKLLREIPFGERLYMEHSPIWTKEEFDYNFNISTDTSLKEGDFVKTIYNNYRIFVVGKIEKDVKLTDTIIVDKIYMKGDDSIWGTRKEVVKIELTQELDFDYE